MPRNGLVLLVIMPFVKSELANSTISHAQWHSGVDWPCSWSETAIFSLLCRALAVHVWQDVRLRRTI